MTPRVIVRLEALAGAAAAITIYARTGGSWWLAHAYVLPLGLALYGYVSGQVLAQHLALIWHPPDPTLAL